MRINCIKNIKNEKGMVAVETLISFIAFLMIMVILTLLINLAAVQTRVHFALTQTVKETAVYSYLFDVFGVTGAISSADELSRKTKDELNGFTNNSADLYDALSEGTAQVKGLNVKSLDDAISAFEDGKGTFEKGKAGAVGSYEQIKAWADDPKEFFTGLLMVLADKAITTGMDALFGYLIAPALFDRYMRVNLGGGKTMDTKAYMRSMGVDMSSGYNPSNEKKGMTFIYWSWGEYRDFFDKVGFQGSHFLTGGNEITLQAKYYYDLGMFLRILPKELTSLEVVQQVQGKAWVGDGKRYESKKK